MDTIVSFSNRYKKWLIAIGVTLILAGVFFMFYYTTPHFRMYMEEGTNALFIPSELRSASFIQGTFAGTRVLTPGLFGYSQTHLFGTSTVSFSHTGATYVAVEHVPGGVYDLVVNNMVTATSSLPITSASISEDGSQVAFSASLEPMATPATSTHPTNANQTIPVVPETSALFQVAVASSTAPVFSTIHILGPGAAPVFLDGMHLLYATFGGMVHTNLNNRKETTLALAEPLPLLRLPLLVSPDHSHVAWYDFQKKTVEVYALSSNVLTYVSSITIPQPYYFALGNKGIYEIRTVKEGSDVWVHSFDGTQARAIYRLPAFMGISRLFF